MTKKSKSKWIIMLGDLKAYNFLLFWVILQVGCDWKNSRGGHPGHNRMFRPYLSWFLSIQGRKQLWDELLLDNGVLSVMRSSANIRRKLFSVAYVQDLILSVRFISNDQWTWSECRQRDKSKALPLDSFFTRQIKTTPSLPQKKPQSVDHSPPPVYSLMTKITRSWNCSLKGERLHPTWHISPFTRIGLCFGL